MISDREQPKSPPLFTPQGVSEASVEAEIQAKGLNAPRLTPNDIDAVIHATEYHRFPGTTVTVCAMHLRNGYVVIGKSAAASPDNFDEEIGLKVAFTDARNQIWALEGYLLRNQLYYGDHPSAGGSRVKSVPEHPSPVDDIPF